MKQDVLLRAVGGVSEALLAETEQGVYNRHKGVKWILIPAAIIALAISAAAVSGLRNVPVLGIGMEEEETVSLLAIVDESGVVSGGVNGYNVFMEVEADIDAPVDVETIYTMDVPEQWDCVHYNVGGGDWFQTVWWITSFKTVKLDQYTFDMADRNYGKNYVDKLWSMPHGAANYEIIDFAGVKMLRVKISAQGMDKVVNADGETKLYWSDGKYVFKLSYPSEMDDKQIITMLNTWHVRN